MQSSFLKHARFLGWGLAHIKSKTAVRLSVGGFSRGNFFGGRFSQCAILR